MSWRDTWTRLIVITLHKLQDMVLRDAYLVRRQSAPFRVVLHTNEMVVFLAMKVVCLPIV